MKFAHACLLACLPFVLAACADPALVQVSPNAYRIVKTDKVRFYRTTAELKSDAVAESNAYAASRGKVAIGIATSEQPLVPGVEYATVKYTFRMVDKTDPEARRVSVSVASAPLVLDKVGGSATSRDIAALDAMHQRGLVDDKEFRTMKARMLARKPKVEPVRDPELDVDAEPEAEPVMKKVVAKPPDAVTSPVRP